MLCLTLLLPVTGTSVMMSSFNEFAPAVQLASQVRIILGKFLLAACDPSEINNHHAASTVHVSIISIAMDTVCLAWSGVIFYSLSGSMVLINKGSHECFLQRMTCLSHACVLYMYVYMHVTCVSYVVQLVQYTSYSYIPLCDTTRHACTDHALGDILVFLDKEHHKQITPL